MFAQFIEGRVTDAAEFKRQYDRWHDQLAPEAEGWLGSTAGVTADGIGFLAARFDSEDAARANSDRPEQGEWWQDMERCFEGEADFLDCDDVKLFRGGGSDDAGFVQVIRGQMSDLDRARQMMDAMDDEDQQRPDVIGGYAGYRPDGTFAQVVYFTSEEEARQGEAADADRGDEFAEVMSGPPRFLDLTDPWLSSAD